MYFIRYPNENEIKYIAKMEKYNNTFEDEDCPGAKLVDLTAWSEKEFFLSFVQNQRRLNKIIPDELIKYFYYFYVVENTMGQIIGYAICVESSSSVAVVKFCIHKPYRKKGAGTFLYEYINKNHKKNIKFLVKEYEKLYIDFCVKKKLKSKLLKKGLSNGDDLIVFEKS